MTITGPDYLSALIAEAEQDIELLTIRLDALKELDALVKQAEHG